MGWIEDNAGWLERARARWTPSHVEPLRVRVWLISPIGWDGYDPISLEGALQFAVVTLETGRLPDDVFAGAPRVAPAEAIDIPVPIEDVQIGQMPIACASVGHPPAIAFESGRWRRKRARADVLGVEKVMINGGPYKSLNAKVSTLTTPWLDFYVRGDRAKILELAPHVYALGRDCTRGLGTVLGMEVDDDPLDRALLHEGRPMRTLPVVMDGGPFDVRSYEPDSFEAREATTRAPYWHRRSVAEAAVPIVRVGPPVLLPAEVA